MSHLIRWAEEGRLPDFLLRRGIRVLLRQRLAELASATPEEERQQRLDFIASLSGQPVARNVDAANAQHYEVPAAFYQQVLGPHLKYSCSLWENGTRDLAQAEEAMLALTASRAELADGQEILELGCGWGSLTLWMAEHFPAARIVAVSNSHSQRQFVTERLRARGLTHVEVRTCDANQLELSRRFDRVVSVEMFEHMRNLALLMKRIASWLEKGGKLFVHVFSHHRHPYLFVDRDTSDWMARHFFTGGMMPCHQLLMELRGPLEAEADWVVPGQHYARTAEAWLDNLDRSRDAVRDLFAVLYGSREAERWLGRWRLFFLAVAELFAFRRGTEWQVSHYRFAKP